MLQALNTVVSIVVVGGVGYVAYKILKNPVGTAEEAGERLWDFGAEVGERVNFGSWAREHVAGGGGGLVGLLLRGTGIVDTLQPSVYDVGDFYSNYPPGSVARPRDLGPPPDGNYYNHAGTVGPDGNYYIIWSPVT